MLDPVDLSLTPLASQATPVAVTPSQEPQPDTALFSEDDQVELSAGQESPTFATYTDTGNLESSIPPVNDLPDDDNGS
ncbi:hypothetical protein SCOR_01890 [Sulfidibacter corallicola]|uniref:Uncharacterized protein n=1 Tax=Sulfidibacter corallicola TaxID=2818388 RepID=A0A8A4TGF4_SULCO|nr:hypothetical protein [Sulfidibacter corallicola]QTD48723.1 hypothetical protein J3U87_24345 [Sulfidibacter corallicola]